MNLRAKTGRILISSISLLLISAGFLLAQPEFPMEKIFLRTDRDSYIAGEEVLFKIYTMDASSQTPVHYSDIVYLELLDRQHSPLIRKKFALRKGESNGAILLPIEMKSEYYYLRAYTSWMKNAGASGYAYQFLSVINPFEKISSEMISSEHDKKFIDNKKQGFQMNPLSGLPGMKILAGFEHKPSGRRQKMILEINTSDSSGAPVEASLMLSIARKGLLSVTDRELPIYKNQQETSLDIPYPPERGGHIIRGKLSQKYREGLFRSDTLIYSVVGKRAIFDYTISDSLGNFRFLAKGMEGPHEIVIQNLNPLKSDCQIRLEDPFSSDFPELQLPSFRLDTNHLENINQAVISAQINALYAEEAIESDPDPVLLSFYGQPEQELILGDYIKLPEMREVFFELIPNAQIHENEDQVAIRIKNKWTDFHFVSEPLMLVDGVVTREALQISELDPQKVERIDLVNVGYYWGILHFPGIVSVFTNEGKCPLNLPNCFLRQSYEFVSAAASPEFPVYGRIEKNPDLNRPDFRNTLYWNPDIRTDENGKAMIEFYTSDDVSDYVLMIRGFTGDGLSGFYTDTISVTDQIY